MICSLYRFVNMYFNIIFTHYIKMSNLREVKFILVALTCTYGDALVCKYFFNASATPFLNQFVKQVSQPIIVLFPSSDHRRPPVLFVLIAYTSHTNWIVCSGIRRGHVCLLPESVYQTSLSLHCSKTVIVRGEIN